MLGGPTAVPRPAHFTFPTFSLYCGNGDMASGVLTTVIAHREAVRAKLGLNRKYGRKIAQRGDGLVLPTEARNHFAPEAPSYVGVQRLATGAMFTLMMLLFFKPS